MLRNYTDTNNGASLLYVSSAGDTFPEAFISKRNSEWFSPNINRLCSDADNAFCITEKCRSTETSRWNVTSHTNNRSHLLVKRLTR